MRRNVVNLIGAAAFAAMAMAASGALADCEDDDGDEADYVAAYRIPASIHPAAALKRAGGEAVMATTTAPARPESSGPRAPGTTAARECRRYFPGTGEMLSVPCSE